MKKIFLILIGLMLFAFVGCSENIKENRKTAEYNMIESYIEAQGYKIISFIGEIDKYVLEKSKLYGGTETIPYQQIWSVQEVAPDKYFGKEISTYCFIVKAHPLQKTYNVNTKVYIMISENKLIGGYSFPNKELSGSLYSLDGRTLEEVTGLSFEEWRSNLQNKYGN